MNDRFAELIIAKEARKDTRLLGDFTVIYCKAHHDDRERTRLESDGVDLGVYGRKAPGVCKECAELLRYAEKRRAFCPKDPKPFCSYCDTHCYKTDMREYMREVMRYAGPRSMWHGHAVDGVKHLIEGKKHKREMERATSTDEYGNGPREAPDIQEDMR
jgi:hypothetical protein